MKYTEIFKLKEMLEKANIPFKFIEHKNYKMQKRNLNSYEKGNGKV